MPTSVSILVIQRDLAQRKRWNVKYVVTVSVETGCDSFDLTFPEEGKQVSKHVGDQYL